MLAQSPRKLNLLKLVLQILATNTQHLRELAWLVCENRCGLQATESVVLAPWRRKIISQYREESRQLEENGRLWGDEGRTLKQVGKPRLHLVTVAPAHLR